jgi:Ca-activated chloride channel homolog
MRFGNILFFHLLWFVIAGLAVLFVWSLRHRRRALKRFADEPLLAQLTAGLDPRRHRLKAALVVCASALLFFSLAHPQWGFHWQEVKRHGLDIIIAIDVSNSMLATDVKPNRLERSKLAVKDLIRKLEGDRLGLIAFAGSAFLQCPLTVDYNGFMLALDALATDTIPRGGTSLARAIKEAMRSFEGGQKKYKVLVIITDGESHEGDPLQWAEKAKAEGIKIFTIGIGTKSGELIPVRDGSGGISFLKDSDGNFVKSRLDEEILQRLALTTGGSYVRASGAQFGLDLIYEQKLSQMEKRELESKMSKRYEERYQLFVLAALVLLMIELFIQTHRREKT